MRASVASSLGPMIAAPAPVRVSTALHRIAAHPCERRTHVRIPSVMHDTIASMAVSVSHR
eukprot:1405776-Rhodomonas_salina.2